MNLAIPGLFIILGILPGIIFFNTFFSGKFSKKFKKLSAINEFSWYLTCALPFNYLIFHYYPEAIRCIQNEIVAYHFNGNLNGFSPLQFVVDFKKWSSEFPVIYLKIILLSFISANFFRRLVWTFRIDLFVPFLKMSSVWYYDLMARNNDLDRWFNLILVDVLTKTTNSETILYRGVLHDFDIGGPDDTLQSITFSNAKRGGGRGGDFKWTEIPGSKFIVFGNTIHSINITYIPASPEDLTILDKGWLYLRSFLFEET